MVFWDTVRPVDDPFSKSVQSGLFTNKSKDCSNCAGIENVISKLREKKNEEELSPQMMEHLQQYWELSKDPDYQHVDFNEANGGIMASHISHHFDKVAGRLSGTVNNILSGLSHCVDIGCSRIAIQNNFYGSNEADSNV